MQYIRLFLNLESPYGVKIKLTEVACELNVDLSINVTDLTSVTFNQQAMEQKFNKAL